MADRRQVSGSSRAKRQRSVLTLHEKVEVLDLLKIGLSFAEVGRRIGKNESSIRTIKRKEAEIRGNVYFDTSLAKRAAVVRHKLLVKAEKALTTWIEDMSRKNVLVEEKVIREKAVNLYEHFSGMVAENERKRFTASKGWLAKYIKRFNLKNLKITEEMASVYFVAASTFPKKFKGTERNTQLEYKPFSLFHRVVYITLNSTLRGKMLKMLDEFTADNEGRLFSWCKFFCEGTLLLTLHGAMDFEENVTS